ncbi:MAG: hypothetical protein AB7R55_15410 [Gemmatimonadales bacterium]
MAPSRGRGLALGLSLSALVACSSDLVAPGKEDKAPFDFAFTDPVADTLPPDASTPEGAGRGADLVGISGSVSADEVTLILTFNEAVAPWSEGAPNSLDGVIDLDVDENLTTGIGDAATGGIGADYYLDLRDASSGTVSLVDVLERSFVFVPARFEGTTVTITVPRSRLGGDDGEFAMTALVGVRSRPVTDVAPETGSYQAHATGGS